MTRRDISIGVVAAIAIASLIGCGGDSTSSTGSANGASTSGTVVQALPTFAFSPSAVTIDVGQSVTWAFGSVGHTVTFDPVAGQPDDIGSVNAPNVNISISRTFGTKGTYTYHCSIHPTMQGVVYVGTTPPSDSTRTNPDTVTNPYGGLRPHH